MKQINVLLLISFVLILSSCSKSGDSKILGKWYSKNHGVTYEFFEDGTFTTYQDEGLTKGKFSFFDEDNLKLEWTTGKAPMMSFKVEYFEDNMIWSITLPDGKEQTVMALAKYKD